MESFICLSVIIFHVGAVSSSTITCPLNETEWIARSKTKLCQGSDVYHCLLVKDGKSRKERCIQKALILKGNCPIFTKDDYIHWKICNITHCPAVAFRSDEVYKYPVCYGHIDQQINFPEDQQSRNSTDVTLMIGITLPIVILAITLALVAILVWKNRRQNLICFSRDRSLDNINMNNESQAMISEGFSRDRSLDNINMNNESQAMISEDESIINGMDMLKNKDVLYIVGHLGNSVSTTGKHVTEEFANQNEMNYQFWNYLKLTEDPPFKPNSVNFVDGWGGLWNKNPCEKDLTLSTMKRVVKQSNLGDKKLVIGLCSDVRDAYISELNKRGIGMAEHETVTLDSSSRYRRVKVQEEIKSLRSRCSSDQCGCKSLDLEQVLAIVGVADDVKIGIYLIVKLISIDHALIPDMLREGPLVPMRRHFENLLGRKQNLSWMPYIVCMGYYDKMDLEQQVANAFNISNDTLSNCDDIDKYAKLIDKELLTPMWSAKLTGNPPANQGSNSRKVYVFQHNFLYICAFHALYSTYPTQTMRFCNLDAILQLVRPMSDSTEPFTIKAGDRHVDIFCEERINSYMNDSKLSVHPLIKNWKSRKGN